MNHRRLAVECRGFESLRSVGRHDFGSQVLMLGCRLPGVHRCDEHGGRSDLASSYLRLMALVWGLVL